jgi:hypothetical protein
MIHEKDKREDAEGGERNKEMYDRPSYDICIDRYSKPVEYSSFIHTVSPAVGLRRFQKYFCDSRWCVRT